MTSLHMLGHMIAIATIAALVKQVLELNKEVMKLHEETDAFRSRPECVAEHLVSASSQHTVTSNGEHKVQSESIQSDNTQTKGHGKGKEEFIDKDPDIMITRSEESGGCFGTDEHCSVTTSVWCHEGVNQVCQFENICYNSEEDEFVIFVDDTSMLENVDIEQGAITVDLSSVEGHNAQQVSVSTLPSHVFSRFSKEWVNDTTLMFRRFLPENIMHMFHDDLIPLHHTLKLIQHGSNISRFASFHVQLLLFENSTLVDDDDDINQFYAIFSKWKVKFKNDISVKGKLTCFQNLYIGLSKTTIWYDYGFTRPQGPVEHIKAQAQHIRRTANYVRQQLATNSFKFLSSDYIILFTRKESRKILNEADLTLHIVKTTGLRVLNLNLENYSLLEIIDYVHNAKGVIAMHGSLLILSMFLKPGSIVVELLPYAVNPLHYTPYKTLCSLKGMDLIYKVWTNQNKEHSVGHPDWSPELGGLNNLEDYQRELIIAQTEFKPAVCCSDPSWLYHIYQDTIVDYAKIVSLIVEAINIESSLNSASSVKSSFTEYPSKVQNVSCLYICNSQDRIVKCHLAINWNTPWTISYLAYNKLQFEVLVQDKSTDRDADVTSNLSDDNTLNLAVTLVDDMHVPVYYVWVRGIIDKVNQGLFSNAVLCVEVDG